MVRFLICSGMRRQHIHTAVQLSVQWIRSSCNYTAMSVDCGHQREAGVTCASCINGNVRLSSGNSLKGQVEVCGNQQWNTVCDSMFNDEAAGVVCRQFGHSQFGEQVILYTHVQLYNTSIGQYLYRIQLQVIVLCMVLERMKTFFLHYIALNSRQQRCTRYFVFNLK